MEKFDFQKTIDEEYAKSLGYDTHQINISEKLDEDMTTLFDYEKKTQEYFENFYY